MIDQLLDGLGDFTEAYLDDLVVFSETWQKHLSHLKVVFKWL